MIPPVEVHVHPASLAHRARRVLGVERRHGSRHLRHLLAEARTERAVVGLELDAALELVRGRDVAHRLHVELLAHEVVEALDGRALAVGRDHHGLAQRLAHLHLGLRARGAAKLDRLPCHVHVPLELLVAGSRLRIVGEVHGLL